MPNLSFNQRMLAHVKTFWEKSHDEEIKELFPFHRVPLHEEIERFQASLLPDAKNFGRVICADDVYIGDVWCYSIDETVEKSAFVSIIIFEKAYWGIGIGKEALSRFCALVFERYAIDKLCAFAYKANVRSCGMLKSAGFHMVEEFEEDGVLSCYYERPRR